MKRLNGEHLKAYLKLNSNAKDYSGYGNNGTWESGTETYADRWDGKSVADFDGAYDGNALSFGDVDCADEFTVSFWIYSRYFGGEGGTQNYGFIIAKQGDYPDINYRMLTEKTTNKFVVEAKIGGNLKTVTSADGYAINEWHHVVGAYNGATLALYIDGELSASTDCSGSLFTDNTDGSIGSYWITDHWRYSQNALIGEVRVYDIGLTGDEIKQLFQMNYPNYAEVEQPIDRIPDVADSTLKGAWLNKSVAGTAKDLSSKNNDGTATDVILEKVGGTFNGTSSFIQIPDSTDFNFDDMTVSFWVKPAANGSYDCVLGQYDDGASDDWWNFERENGSTIYFKVDDGSTITEVVSTTTLAVGKWYHVVGVRKADGYLKIYVNGVEEDSAVETAHTVASDQDVFIGKQYALDRFFDGEIKDVRIYSEAKTADWVASEYSRGVPDDSLELSVLDGTKDLSAGAKTLTNTATIIGKSMDFDGSTSQITGTDTGFPAGASARTICAWINPDTVSVNYQGLFGYGTGSNNNAFLWSTSGTTAAKQKKLIIGKYGQNSSPEPNTGLVANKWQFVGATLDADGNVLYYYNGESDGTATLSGVDTTLNSTMFFGLAYSGGQKYDGQIKDLRLYSELKNATWFKEQYEKTRKYY